MYSKFQFNSKWRVGGAWTTQLVSKYGLNYLITGIVGVGLPDKYHQDCPQASLRKL